MGHSGGNIQLKQSIRPILIQYKILRDRCEIGRVVVVEQCNVLEGVGSKANRANAENCIPESEDAQDSVVKFPFSILYEKIEVECETKRKQKIAEYALLRKIHSHHLSKWVTRTIEIPSIELWWTSVKKKPTTRKRWATIEKKEDHSIGKYTRSVITNPNNTTRSKVSSVLFRNLRTLPTILFPISFSRISRKIGIPPQKFPSPFSLVSIFTPPWDPNPNVYAKESFTKLLKSWLLNNCRDRCCLQRANYPTIRDLDQPIDRFYRREGSNGEERAENVMPQMQMSLNLGKLQINISF